MKVLLLFFAVCAEILLLPPKFSSTSNIQPFKIKKQVPVLCYHNIYQKPKKEDALTISELHLDQQMKTLHDSGYHTISTVQLYQYLSADSALPSKTVIISFDDAHEQQFSIAKSILENYGFRGLFFVMTVCIDKKTFLSREQIKKLSEDGHEIGAHTWDHPVITGFRENDWEKQIEKPKDELQKIIGKPVESFAYPYGVWNDKAIGELKKYGIKTAFQLTGKQSQEEPLFTVERVMVSGLWTGEQLLQEMAANFTVDK